MNGPPTLKIKIQIMCGDEIAMGPGKADLLEAIAGAGSISAAARALGMSYRRAWLLVDAMNRCWRDPLVATMADGSPRSGARVSPLGEEVLRQYRALCLQAGQAAGAEWAVLAERLRAAPLERQNA